MFNLNLTKYHMVLLLLYITTYSHTSIAEKLEEIYPTAIITFEDKIPDLKGIGQKVTDVLFSTMASSDRIYMVDREHMKNILDEASLNLSGLVNAQQAIQIGQLTGARILVTGSVFDIDGTLMILAKIVGTETSRVIGVSVRGQRDDNLFDLAEQLSEKVVSQIQHNSTKLVAKKTTREDQIAALRQQIKGERRPSVAVDIRERHISNTAPDPAAETEIGYFLTELGFPTIDKHSKNSKNADYRIEGEGFSEFATRHGDIISVKARLEVKLIDALTGRVLYNDRQIEVEVDLTEHIAGKKALQRAAAALAYRLIPKLAESP